jgi:arsenate reductase-like glutaredoxin family protein
VAVSSPSFKKLERPLDSFSEEELLEMVLAEPRLLRRPLLVTDDGRVLTGGKAVEQV